MKFVLIPLKITQKWRFYNSLSGPGIALLIMTYIRCLMHAMEMSYGFFYTFASFEQPFPWSPAKYNISKW